MNVCVCFTFFGFWIWTIALCVCTECMHKYLHAPFWTGMLHGPLLHANRSNRCLLSSFRHLFGSNRIEPCRAHSITVSTAWTECVCVYGRLHGFSTCERQITELHAFHEFSHNFMCTATGYILCDLVKQLTHNLSKVDGSRYRRYYSLHAIYLK